MHLHIIRHAIAEGHRPGLDDAARGLTAKGRDRMRRAVRGLARLEVRFDLILTSPKRRARETAALLAPLSEREVELEELLATPPGPALVARLGGLEEASVALVGHEPWLSELASLLMTGTAEGARLQFKKGAVCVLDGRPGLVGMTLTAHWPPRTLRRIGG